MLPYQKLPRWLKVSLAFPLIFLNGWLIGLLYHSLQPISSIVIAACLVTFLLDYPIAFLERRGLPRAWAIGSVLVVAIALVGAIGFGLLPIVFRQLEEFVNRLPAWLTAAQEQVDFAFGLWVAHAREVAQELILRIHADHLGVQLANEHVHHRVAFVQA